MRFLFALFAAFSLSCIAAPYSIRLGIEKLVLDAPPGFTDTTDLASPRLQDLAATLSSDSNRVLMFALSDADVRRFSQGDPIEARRYMIAVTPKGLERERVSVEGFTALVSESTRELGAPAAPVDLVKHLETQPIGHWQLLDELRRDAASLSVLQATRLPPLAATTFWGSSKPQYQVSTTTLLLLRGKALRVAVFSLYDSPADIDWVKSVTLRWVEDLQRLNAR